MEKNFKVGHVFDDRLMPKFSILNPKFTMTVPDNQMKAGIYDIMWTATWALNTPSALVSIRTGWYT